MKMIQDNNLKSTRSFLKIDKDMADDVFKLDYAAKVERIGSKYDQVVKTLFGANGGKVDGNESKSLFTGARYRNGIFSSGIVDNVFLSENRKDLDSIRQILFELSATGDDTDMPESILNRMSKNGFGKSMRNIEQAVTQALTGTNKPIIPQDLRDRKARDRKADKDRQAAQALIGTEPIGPVQQTQAEQDLRERKAKDRQADKDRRAAQANTIPQDTSPHRVTDLASAQLDQSGEWKYRRTQYAGEFFNGGVVGGKGGRDNNVVRASRGEGIVKTSTMNKIGSKGFEQLNKTGSLPQEELKSSVDMLMKTPTWMADFTSAVKALAGTSIKAELAPVSVNVRINGAEVLASLNADMKNLIKREVVTAVSNMYHDNSGKHMIRGME